MLGAGGASRLAKDGRLAAVPALADLSGPLPPFVGKVPLVLYALWTLVPGLFALPAVLVCVASLGRGCFLMGSVAVGLGDAAFRLLRTAGPGGRVFRVFGAVFLPGPATLELVFLLWAVPGRGKENSKVRPSTRLGGQRVVLERHGAAARSADEDAVQREPRRVDGGRHFILLDSECGKLGVIPL